MALAALKFSVNTARDVDPTRTIILRGQFISQVNKRFRDLKNAITHLLTKDNFLEPAVPQEYRPGITLIGLAAKYEYLRSDVKVDLFMDWLKDQESQGILEITQRPGGLRRGQSQAWTDTYIQSSYQRGIGQARADLRTAGADISSFQSIPGGVAGVFNQPFHADRVALIYTRCFNEMEGITEAMNGHLSRELALGMAQGQSPYQIARRINEKVDNIGIVRGRLIARTEIVQSHNEAALNEYERAEIEIGEPVLVEWVAVMDDRTRSYHAARNGKVYERDVARGMLGEPNCLLDGQVQIYSSKGWQRVMDIKVGDLVLTHKGRFRKVMALSRSLGKRGDEVTKIQIKKGSYYNENISVTSNHPLLIGGKWIAAKDIKEGDKIRYLATKCKGCRTIIPWHLEFCNSSCQNHYSAVNQWKDNDARRKRTSQKATLQLNREYGNGTRDPYKITKKANEKSRHLAKEGKWILQQPHIRDIIRKVTNTPEMKVDASIRQKKFFELHPEKTPWVIQGDRGFVSIIEKEMMHILKELGIDYIHQFPVLRFRPDFRIKEQDILIECDGDYWHKNTKIFDQERDLEIKEKTGFDVFRFSEARILEDRQGVKNEVARIVNNHSGNFEFLDMEIVKVEQISMKRNLRLYNFAVEGDESYIVKGFVSHNCRCGLAPWVESLQKKAPAKKVVEKLGKVTSGFKATPEEILGHYNKSKAATFIEGKNAFELKDAIAKRLGKRMEKLNVPGWKELIKDLGLDRGGNERAAASIIKQWATSSGDAHPKSIAMQLAAQKEFGLKGVSLWWDKDALEMATKYFKTHEIPLRRFLREMYNDTQEHLAKQGLKSIRVTRGFKGDVGIKLSTKANKMSKTNIQLQPMSSFSSDFETAQHFGDPLPTQHSALFFAEVPAKRVLSCPVTGFGCEREFEWVVLGSQKGKETVLSSAIAGPLVKVEEGAFRSYFRLFGRFGVGENISQEIFDRTGS